MEPLHPRDGDSEAQATAPAVAGGAYAVKLPLFEGPLDLLLHLIRQNEVEITDISIARVGEQYLDYLTLMRELDLDVAGDYLVMAATLALIKSRMLLPPDGAVDEEEAADPRAELVARLLEYQRFKEVAAGLAKRRLLGRDVFAARGAEPDRTPEAERELSVDLFQLLSAFREVLARGEDAAGPHEVEVETITVRERMLAVMDTLGRSSSVEFTQLFDGPEGRPPSRALLVTTFLAVLELSRLAALRVFQGISDSGAPAGPIRIRAVTDVDQRSWSERISELM